MKSKGKWKLGHHFSNNNYITFWADSDGNGEGNIILLISIQLTLQVVNWRYR